MPDQAQTDNGGPGFGILLIDVDTGKEEWVLGERPPSIVANEVTKPTKGGPRSDAKGSVVMMRGRVYIRITVGKGKGKRHAYQVPWATTLDEARPRAALMATMARDLRSTGEPLHLDVLPKILERTAVETTAKRLEELRGTVDRLAGGMGRVSDHMEASLRIPLSLPIPRRLSGVYVLLCGTAVKIGRAEDLHRRIRTLQVGNPQEIEFLCMLSERPSDEDRWHSRFSDERRHPTEWFDLSERLIRAIVQAQFHYNQNGSWDSVSETMGSWQ